MIGSGSAGEKEVRKEVNCGEMVAPREVDFFPGGERLAVMFFSVGKEMVHCKWDW